MTDIYCNLNSGDKNQTDDVTPSDELAAADEFQQICNEFTHWVEHTYLTDETYVIQATGRNIEPVSNDHFLETIFQTDSGPVQDAILVCSKAGDPQASGWLPRVYPTNVSSSKLNWYFAPSTFVPQEDGTYHSKSKLAKATYCIVLDDVGQKVPFEKILPCPPTWVIQTSPGCCQVGYAFDKRQTDFLIVEQLKAALIAAQLCDAGASGAIARWSRLPNGINGKSKYGNPSPQCKLLWWRPKLKYSIDQLVERFSLVSFLLPNTPSNAQSLARSASDEFSIFSSDENTVITKLKALGIYKYEAAAGVHEITCPWVSEHTDQIDSGTAYFEPSHKYRIGGFKCHHSHGSKFRIKELLEFLNIGYSDAKNLPIITVYPGEIPKILEEVEWVLTGTQKFYVRGGAVVSLHRDEHSDDLEVRMASRSSLIRTVSLLSTWEKKIGHVLKICDPPNKYIDLLLDGQDFVYLKQLKSIARQPFFSHAGDLVIETGYDAESGIYCDFNKNLYTFNLKPDKADAIDAVNNLKQLLGEFSFASDVDQTTALAAIITGVVRQSLKNAPLFHIKAPQIASGKSYLTDLIASFASPRLPSAYAYPTSDEECQKLLLAVLINSPAVVIFDNLTTDLIPHNTMCSALTQEQLTGRILGSTKVATVGTQVLFLSSGNNVEPVQDMTRRTITIALDPKIETPATKVYVGNPVKTVRTQREHFVGLVLTIVQAWIVAGRPITNCKPVNGYDEWTNLVRQPLLWLPMADPATRLFQQLEHDPGKETLGRVLSAWLREFGSVPTMIREVCQRAEPYVLPKNEELREALLEVAEERKDINRRKLGRWVARNEGRIVGALRFERGQGNSSAERWLVRQVRSVSSVKSVICDSNEIESSSENSNGFELVDDGNSF